MKKDIWIQLIIGAIILVPLGFLGKSVFEMNSTLSSVSTKVTSTNDRVNRIADVLPEVKIRIALEEINNPLEGFVVVTNPVEQSPGTWVSKAAVYNSLNSELSIHSLKSNEQDIEISSYAIAGRLKAENPYDTSFNELKSYSTSLNQAVYIPNNLNLDTSFILRTANADELNSFIEALSESEAKTTKIVDIKNWKELIEHIELINDKMNEK